MIVHGRFQIPNSKSFTLPILITLYPPDEYFARYEDIDPSEGFGKDESPSLCWKGIKLLPKILSNSYRKPFFCFTHFISTTRLRF